MVKDVGFKEEVGGDGARRRERERESEICKTLEETLGKEGRESVLEEARMK